MPRRALSLSLFFAAAALTGCQDYNFNPVTRCAIQPGGLRRDVSKFGTADVLFVVDDSGSMAPEQARLAANFDKFIGALAEVQKERTDAKLQPFEFHIAVTTTSVFEAWQVSTNAPLCGADGATPLQCVVPQSQTNWYVPGGDTATCSVPDAACNDVVTHFAYQVATDPPGSYFKCSDPGVATAHAAFPSGDFVALGNNPRVLHFTKDLDWQSWVSPWTGATDYAPGQSVTNGGNTYECITRGTSGAAGPTGAAADITDGSAHWKYVAPTSIDAKLSTLVQEFKDNIAVGACGSSMEQPFQAGELALKKALRQDGLEQPVAQSEFMHSDSKLVVVFVGDEDDCSNPEDATKSLAFTADASLPGADVCIADQLNTLAQQKLFHVTDYADFLTGLGRPLAAAFVYSAQLANDGKCLPDGKGGCTPGGCTCQCPAHCLLDGGICDSNRDPSGDCWLPPVGVRDQCGGQDPYADRSRYHELSAELRSRKAGGLPVDTFESSVCQADWADTLQEIAKLVVPPSSLTLPAMPADKDVVALSIQDADGNPRSYCDGPDPSKDWWFVTDPKDPRSVSTEATQYIAVSQHPSTKCQPNPGESYVAFFLVRVGPDSCSNDNDCNNFFSDMKDPSFECVNPGTSQSTCVCKPQS